MVGTNFAASPITNKATAINRITCHVFTSNPFVRFTGQLPAYPFALLVYRFHGSTLSRIR